MLLDVAESFKTNTWGEIRWFDYSARWVRWKPKLLEGYGTRAHYNKGVRQTSQDGHKAHAGYKKLPHPHNGLAVHERLRENGMRPDLSILLAALKVCSNTRDIRMGTKIHAVLIHSKNDSNLVAVNSVLHMYCKCGSRLDACKVFDRVPKRDVVSWNILIFGYSESGEFVLALQLFASMQDEGLKPNSLTYVAALKACAGFIAKEKSFQSKGKLVKAKWLNKVISIHSQVTKCEHEFDILVANTLVDTYAKCGSMVHACQVFDRMPSHDIVSWNSVMFGYAELGKGELVLQLFASMQDAGFTANAFTYVAALKACAICAAKEAGKRVNADFAKLEFLERGLSIHSQLAKSENESDIFVANTLVDMYAKCRSMIHARCVFDKMPHHTGISWNALMFGYVESEQYEIFLQLFTYMQDDGIMPDALTYIAALKACASCAAKEESKKVAGKEGKLIKLESLEKGIIIHSQLTKGQHELDIFVASTLVDMYAKCGCLEHAQLVFEMMPHNDLVSWNALLFGYVESGECQLALRLFECMQDEGLIPDSRTYVAALKACGTIAAMETGIKIHLQICNAGLQSDTIVATSLVVFYSKCGSMIDAEQVFYSMSTRNLVAWSALLGGYAQQGDMTHVLDSLKKMQGEGFQADSISFLSVLTACRHAGLIEKGKEYFHVMCVLCLISPAIEHYACIIDLLGRANCLVGAMFIVENMPFEPNLTIWRTLLAACQIWKNEMVGKLSFESILRLGDVDASAYVLMSSIYAGSGIKLQQL